MNNLFSVFFLSLLFLLKSGICAAQLSSDPMPLFVEGVSDDTIKFTPSQALPLKVLKLDRQTLSMFASNNTNAISVNYAGRDVVFFKTHSSRTETVSNFSGQDASGETSIILTVADDHLFGRIQGRDGEIKFEPSNRSYEVKQSVLDLTKEMPLIDDGVLAPTGYDANIDLHGSINSRGASSDNGQRIDVMVLYTNGVAAAHPEGEVYTRIAYLIYLTNLAFLNSEINTYLRLVHYEQVAYTDDSPGGMLEALEDLQENAGVFKGVEQKRNKYGADQVTLLRRFVDEGCGIGWVLRNFNPAFSYAVTHEGSQTNGSGWRCSEYTYAHELGHNLGSAHDRANSNVPGIFDYSHGYQNPSSSFRTIMAYNCDDNCPRVAHYSNPNVDYQSNPTGIASTRFNSANNALTFNQTRVAMAGYRAEIVWPGAKSLSGIINLLLSG